VVSVGENHDYREEALEDDSEEDEDDDDAPYEYGDLFANVRQAMTKLHAIAPIAQVVYLNARAPSKKDAWEAWTLAKQPRPTAWPDFGHVALYFKP
jgi:hypothetical protein